MFAGDPDTIIKADGVALSTYPIIALI